MTSRFGVAMVTAAFAATTPQLAYADGKRDLDDGIAFYENLDTDRAIERLEASVKDPALGDDDRALAYLYMGMVHFELGDHTKADQAWHSAFSLRPDIGVPEGTSPKTIEGMEAARVKAKAAPTPPPRPPELPKVEDKPPPPSVTPPPPAEEPADDGPNWLLWGGVGGGAVAVAVVVAVIVAGGGGSDCMGDGGCAVVSFQ